jgi:hypothetical protein
LSLEGRRQTPLADAVTRSKDATVTRGGAPRVVSPDRHGCVGPPLALVGPRAARLATSRRSTGRASARSAGELNKKGITFQLKVASEVRGDHAQTKRCDHDAIPSNHIMI